MNLLLSGVLYHSPTELPKMESKDLQQLFKDVLGSEREQHLGCGTPGLEGSRTPLQRPFLQGAYGGELITSLWKVPRSLSRLLAPLAGVSLLFSLTLLLLQVDSLWGASLPVAQWTLTQASASLPSWILGWYLCLTVMGGPYCPCPLHGPCLASF